MGNSAPGNNLSTGFSPPTLTPTPSQTKNRVPFQFKLNGNIYNEILKDAQKLRLQDKKNGYNAHRRAESIAACLPKQLQSYSNAIHIVNEFWLQHIEPLCDDELNQLVMVLYCRLFLKCKKIRNLLLIAQKNNISSHALKIFHVFGYVIRNLIHPSNHLKLFRQLQALGSVHRTHSLTNDGYEGLLEAFNFAMEEKFENNYKIRTRFCFSQLYRVIVDIMTGEDFYSFTMRQLTGVNNNNNYNNEDTSDKHSLAPIITPFLKRLSSGRDKKDIIYIHHGVNTLSNSSLNDLDCKEEYDDDELKQLQENGIKTIKRSSTQRQALFNQIDGFLGSLEECLSDEIGSLYFKKYLEEQFCVENFLFHQYVLKYKSAKSTQRIKIGQEIINQFVEIGSEKEVNLSYNTRKQILTIVNLVKKMNDNKEKYQQLLITKKNNKNRSIMNEDDIKYLNKHNNNNNNNNGHYRMATTKKLPLELAEITNDANESIQDVVYSMGYTQSLFDKAYDEIFNLMRTNSWNNFKNTILEYCDDDEFVKLQKEKLELKKETQRNNFTMIQAINSITRSHRKHTMNENNNNNDSNDDDHKKQKSSIHDIFKQRKGVMVIQKKKHYKKKSKDDFDLNYSTQVHANYNPTKYKTTNRKRNNTPNISLIMDQVLSPKGPKHFNMVNKNKNSSISYSKATRIPLHERFNTKSSIIHPLSELEQISFDTSKSSIQSDYDDYDNNNDNDYDFDDDKSVIIKQQTSSQSPITDNNMTPPHDDIDTDIDIDIDVDIDINNQENNMNAISEDYEITMKMEAFKNGKDKPRLSFIPTILPAIEKSETSPTVQMNSQYSVRSMTDMTPGGGAAVGDAAVVIPVPFINTNIKKKSKQLSNFSGNGSYSPSELFSLVSSTLPEPDHYYKKNKYEITRKRSSGISNNSSLKGLPLYAKSKKRKSKSKRNALKRANVEDY